MAEPDSPSKPRETAALIAKLVLAFLLILLFVLVFGGVLQFLWFKQWFDWFSDKISAATGINIWLARTFAIAAIAVLPIIFRAFCPQIVPDWLYNKYFKRRRKQYAWYQTLLIFVTACLLMYAFTKDNLLGKYYLYDPITDRILLFDSGGLDQKTTMEKRPIDSYQIAQEIRLFIASQKRISGPTRFFDERGLPLYRYYRNDNGLIEMYPKFLRIHPRYGIKMESISSDIVREYEAQHVALLKASPDPISEKTTHATLPSSIPNQPEPVFAPTNSTLPRPDKIADAQPPKQGASISLPPTASLKHIALSIEESVDGVHKADVAQSMIIEILQESGYHVSMRDRGTDSSRTMASTAGIIIRGTVECKTSDLGDRTANLGYQVLGQAAKGITVAECKLKVEIINNNTGNSVFLLVTSPQGKPNNRDAAIQESLISCAGKAKEQILGKIASVSK